MSNLHNRHTLLIYRDLIRLIHTVMNPDKQVAVLTMMRKEFEKNRKINDDDEIIKLKKSACKSIGDLYLYYVKNTVKDNRNVPNPDNLL